MAKRPAPRRGRSRRRLLIIVVAAALVVGLGGAYAVFALQSSGSPPPASLPVALPSSSASPASSAASENPDGTWKVNGNGSFVGYRVREKLAVLPAPSDAVGRTTAVEGSLKVAGLSVTAVNVTADLQQLTSDKSMRDQRIHTVGLETDTFPTATFTLTSPITFSSKPASGTVVKRTVTGKLTLHGVTRTVTVSVQARWTPGEIDIAGSIPIQFSDYQITAPNFAGFVSVDDHGTAEFSLRFAQQ